MSVLRWTPEQLSAHQKRLAKPVAKVAPVNVAKPNKYGAVKTDGYHSKKEAKRAEHLRERERLGLIRRLQEQVKYVLIPSRRIDGKVVERECAYIADFVYDEEVMGQTLHWFGVVEDCKGYRDAVYRIKRKLMLHVHGIRIRET